MGNLTEQTSIHNIRFGVDQMWRAFALSAHLNHLAVLTGGCHHGFAFHHVDADGLLHVDVGTGFYGINRLKCVPMVGRANEDNVEFVLSQHFTVVAIKLRHLTRFLPLADQFGCVVQHVLIDIAERHHLYGRYLNEPEQVTFTIPTRANQADPIGLIGVDVEAHATGTQRR